MNKNWMDNFSNFYYWKPFSNILLHYFSSMALIKFFYSQFIEICFTYFFALISKFCFQLLKIAIENVIQTRLNKFFIKIIWIFRMKKKTICFLYILLSQVFNNNWMNSFWINRFATCIYLQSIGVIRCKKHWCKSRITDNIHDAQMLSN